MKNVTQVQSWPSFLRVSLIFDSNDKIAHGLEMATMAGTTFKLSKVSADKHGHRFNDEVISLFI
jgi:hypothetical protein